MADEKNSESSQPLKERAVMMTTYLLPADYRRLKVIAASEDTSLQGLMLDAIDRLFADRGQPSVKRWQPRRRVVRPE